MKEVLNMEKRKERKIAHRAQKAGTEFRYLVQLEPRVSGEGWITGTSSLNARPRLRCVI